ncbi:hypothetical protein FCV25MIE_04961 [Fagus crenata]
MVIKRMLLPNLLSQDQVFWKVTPTGYFTVKSAYALAQKQSGSLDFSSSSKVGTENACGISCGVCMFLERFSTSFGAPVKKSYPSVIIYIRGISLRRPSVCSALKLKRL